MESLLAPLVVVFSGVVFLPALAKRIRVPVIILELLFGIIIGSTLLNLIPRHSVIDFLSSFGLTYLMFLAGMETDLGRIGWVIMKKVLLIAVASVGVPVLLGSLLGLWINVNPWLLGTILSATSLGLVLATLRELKMSRRLRQMLLVSVVVVDVISMFLLAFVLAAAQGKLQVSYIYSALALLILFFVPWFINRRKLRRKITRKLFKNKESEIEMRVAFAIIVLLGAVSHQLGFHSIIGAFIAGLLVSEILPRRTLDEERLQSFGYSFFIPLFFIFTGAKVDLAPVFSSLDNIAGLVAIVIVGLGAKVIGVTLASRLSGLKWKQSMAFGFSHMANLSLIIAAADISLELGLINTTTFGTFIILAIISAVIAPLSARRVLET